MLSYKGDLYAKIKRKYLKLEMTATDVDKLVEENKALKKECLYVNEVNMELSKQIPAWHYPSKGEYPQECTVVLCCDNHNQFFLCDFIEKDCWEYMPRRITVVGDCDILAWQPLPNPPEDCQQRRVNDKKTVKDCQFVDR